MAKTQAERAKSYRLRKKEEIRKKEAEQSKIRRQEAVISENDEQKSYRASKKYLTSAPIAIW